MAEKLEALNIGNYKTGKYVGEVILPKGSLLRMGEVNPVFGFKGGGIQFDLMGQFIGDFKELGKIIE
ncbi:hypothetical protein [Streptococcus zhangguiae]|uniref:DUF4237 domain-containing protein n=1 Tax=Streptococcus zhangguiae TaxID=2664091 RepID=A0A6I4RHI4_9STRE|nr:hypothetical protein [Streptococcus sp. zg-70]MWV55913.1 hypothetical protein [Streptococcus sp. zg-70]